MCWEINKSQTSAMLGNTCAKQMNIEFPEFGIEHFELKNVNLFLFSWACDIVNSSIIIFDNFMAQGSCLKTRGSRLMGHGNVAMWHCGIVAIWLCGYVASGNDHDPQKPLFLTLAPPNYFKLFKKIQSILKPIMFRKSRNLKHHLFVGSTPAKESSIRLIIF